MTIDEFLIEAPSVIYSNRMYKSKEDLSGEIIYSTKQLTTSCCHNVLTIIAPYKFNDWQWKIKYSDIINVSGNDLDDLFPKVLSEIERLVINDYDEHTAEYHSIEYLYLH